MQARFLLKRAFKSLFKNKLFVILMSLLVLITSGTYTTLESVSSSFKESYDQVVKNGNLHDYVMKENFQLSGQDQIDMAETFVITHDINGNEVETSLLADPNDPTNVSIVKQIIDDWYQGRNSPAASSTTNTSGLYSRLSFEVRSKQDFTSYGFNNDPKSASFNPLNAQIDLTDWANTNQDVYDIRSSVKAMLESKLKKVIANSYVTKLKDLYSNSSRNLNVLDINEMNSISVSNNQAAFKVVKYNANTSVNKMFVYDGTQHLSKPLTTQQLVDEVVRQENEKIAVDSNVKFSAPNTLKGYRVTAQDQVSRVVSAVDASAYQAIVSPTYANANDKTAMSMQEFNNWITKPFTKVDGSGLTNFFDALSKDERLAKQLNDHIVWVDKTPYIILGVGQTPDFAYPIIDEKHPIIDKKNQAIVYVNSRGFERIEDGFRANPRENYISLKFHDNVEAITKEKVINELKEITKNNSIIDSNGNTISFPKNTFGPNVQMVTTYDDPNDQMTLTQERTSFLSSLQKTIYVVSNVTTTLLVVFVLLIISMVFGVLISANRKSLATLLAMGYRKSQIAFSTATISLLIGALPALVGYLIGYSMQFMLINKFDDFWTIPTYGHAFSWLSLVITFVIPFIMLFVLLAMIVMLSLNFSIPSMLRDSVRDNSWIVAKLLSPFKRIGIRTKYALALTLRNSGKIVLLTSTMTISSIALMVGLSTITKASSAYQETVNVTNYNYKVDLVSPTVEGGQYQNVSYAKGADSKYSYKIQDTVNQVIPEQQVSLFSKNASNQQNLIDKRAWPHWHIPSIEDKYVAMPDANDAQQLTQKTAIKAYEEIEPVAHYLRNKIQTKALLDFSLSGINPWNVAEQLMPDNQINAANQNFSDLKQKAKDLKISFNTTSQQKVIDDFFNLVSDERVGEAIKPYLITYDTIVTDADDEPYTYIESNMELAKQKIKMNVTGLVNNSKMYNIPSDKIINLEKEWDDNSHQQIPILINKYAAESYHLSKGSTFSFEVLNDVDRNFRSHQKHEEKYIVSDIINGYNDTDFITSQKIANEVVGATKMNNNKSFFNGMFSRSEDSTLLSTLPLYSPSGFYFATDTIVDNSAFSAWLEAALSNNIIWPFANDIASSKAEFIATYSNSPLQSMVNKVNWQKMDGVTFSSVSHLTSSMIDVIEGISISLSAIFMIIVISLVIHTNKKRIATLWTIGYRKREIINIFATTSFIPILVTLIVAIPISIGIIAGLRGFIMMFGHILIPFTLAIWIPFVVVSLVALVYWASTAISIRTLSNKAALEAFKED